MLEMICASNEALLQKRVFMAYNILLDFKKYPDPNLVIFAKNVNTRMKDNARYLTEQPQVDKCIASLQGFESAVTDAQDGGRVLNQIRTEMRSIMLTDFTVLAKMLELHVNEDLTFFTEAGFFVRKRPVRSELPLERPILKFIKQGILSGSIDGEVENFPIQVTQLGVRYSTDHGTTWQNGTYSSGKRFTLSGLNPRKEHLVAVVFLGTQQRMSDWSEAMQLFVL